VKHVIETSFSAFPFGFFFPENIRPISDEHGESFFQGISQTEKRYSGKLSPNMLADQCWNLIRETLTGENKRQKKTKRVFNEFVFA
jgi:hypothetical protein